MKKFILAIPVFLMFFCFTSAVNAQSNAAEEMQIGAQERLFQTLKTEDITEFTSGDIEKMKQETEEDINKVIEYKLFSNKPGATKKDVKTARKGLEKIIERRTDAYFKEFQERIDYVNSVLKAAERNFKAEKKNRKAYIKQEAGYILSEKAPLFRLPEPDKIEKPSKKEIKAKKNAAKKAEKQKKEAAKALKQAEKAEKKAATAEKKALKNETEPEIVQDSEIKEEDQAAETADSVEEIKGNSEAEAK